MTQSLALGLTLFIECMICGLYLTRIPPPRPSLFAGLIICIAASCFTHPVAWMLNTTWSATFGTWATILTLEVLVILVEGLVYRLALTIPAASALRLSIATNAGSFLAGLVLYWYGLDGAGP